MRDNAYPTPPFVEACSYIVVKHIPPIGCARVQHDMAYSGVWDGAQFMPEKV